jgi:hypothetical protein
MYNSRGKLFMAIGERPAPFFRDRKKRVIFALESGLLFVPYGFLLAYVLINPFGDLLAALLQGAPSPPPSVGGSFAYVVASALVYAVFVALVMFFASPGLGVRTFKGFSRQVLLWSVILLSPLWLLRSLVLYHSREQASIIDLLYAALRDPSLLSIEFFILFILFFGIIMTSLLRGKLARAALLYFILWLALTVWLVI